MQEPEEVARRVSEVCADLREAVANVGLDMLAHILSLAILEANKTIADRLGDGPTMAPQDPP